MKEGTQQLHEQTKQQKQQHIINRLDREAYNPKKKNPSEDGSMGCRDASL
jgi:hypothetical protein